VSDQVVCDIIRDNASRESVTHLKIYIYIYILYYFDDDRITTMVYLMLIINWSCRQIWESQTRISQVGTETKWYIMCAYSRLNSNGWFGITYKICNCKHVMLRILKTLTPSQTCDAENPLTLYQSVTKLWNSNLKYWLII
jgi:hypothetical protein